MFKKFFLKFALVSFFSLYIASSAFAIDYAYNAMADTHMFSYEFPSNWFARTFGEKKQGFSPNLTDENLKFEILEFEGQSVKQISNYFTDEKTEFIEFDDQIFSSKNEDLIAKQAIYLDKTTNKKFARSFFKRGNIVLAVSSPNLTSEYFPYDRATNEIIKKIYNSLSFNDSYRSYIDYENNFSLSFPEKFLVEKDSDEEKNITVFKDPVSKKVFFQYFVYKDKTIDKTINTVKTINQKLDSRTENEIEGTEKSEKIVFVDLGNGKKTAYIFVQETNDTLVFTDENTEPDFPASEYHNTYIKEILSSLEFFSIDGDYFPFLIFKDVRDNHPNAPAINHLANSNIVKGYEDKTFGPEKEITRAELTKIIVESIKPGDISEYENCFPDVKEEWFASYICFAKEKNWISGYKDGQFRPSNKVTRAESLKIIYEILTNQKIENFSENLKDDLPTDISKSAWYFKYYTYFQNRKLLDLQHIIKADDESYKYLPNDNIKRQEIAEIVYRMKLF